VTVGFVNSVRFDFLLFGCIIENQIVMEYKENDAYVALKN
jgi:hypothetical protein